MKKNSLKKEEKIEQEKPEQEKPKMILDLYELANKLNETKRVTTVRFDWN